MQIEQIELTKLVPYARNSRVHSDEQIAQIMASIKEFGFTNPVLIDSDNQIIAGHGRVIAAQRLEMKIVPTITLEHLTDAQKKAYVIADNKLALNAGWDPEMLRIELDDLGLSSFDLTLTGFSKNEIERINESLDVEPPSDFSEFDEGIETQYQCPKCKYEWSGAAK